jgi:hypothetical protein
MTKVFTEAQHMGEFLVSEGEGTISREKGTLLSGEKVIDGCVAILSAGKLKAGSGASGEHVVGIFLGAHDASATGANADIVGVPYIARMAEADSSLVTPKASGTVDWAQLNALFIIGR